MNVDYGGTQLTIKPRTAATLGEAEWLTIRTGGFASLDNAEQFGRDLKGHLRLAAVEAHFALDVGADVVVSGFGPTVIDAARAQGAQLLHGVHGLLVYEETARDLVGWGTAGGFVSSLPEKLFVDALGRAEQLRPARDESALGLACDLVALAEFETSGRARFVSLVTALEALVGGRSATPDRLRAPIGVVASVALMVYFLGAVVTVLRAHAVAHVLFPLMYAAPVVGALVLELGG